MTALLDLDAIRTAHPIQNVAGASLKLQRAGREWKACCPFHEDRSPSFTIFDGGRRFQCFGCGAAGDVLDYVQRAHGVGLREAADMLGGGSVPTIPAGPVDVWTGPDRTDEARTIWRNASPIKGTVAETYLRGRAIQCPLPDSIRFARLPYGKGGAAYPCLIALIARDDRMTGIQRTFLKEDGSGKADVPKAKLSLGRVAGGAIRLTPCAAELVVCEGLEDGLSLLQELGGAVWAAAGASMLPSMQFPPGVRSIVIGADGDGAGEAAARKAATSFSARGLSVRIIRPRDGCKDFNQELMEPRA